MRLRWHVVKNHYPKVNVDWKRVSTFEEAQITAQSFCKVKGDSAVIRKYGASPAKMRYWRDSVGLQFMDY